MSVYVPETVPLDVCSPELSEYLFREFLRIGDAAEVAGRITLPELNIAPSRPLQGDIFYADGVNWNPGGGEGIYGRVNSTWIKLSEGIGLDPTFDDITVDTILGGAATFDTLTLNNGQIVFPAIQNPSANVNTLDDYEEGTFTPRIDGQTTAGVGTYSAQVGRYTKIGRVVFFLATCVWTAHTGTGSILMEGLPFTCSATDSSASSVEYSNLTYTSQIQCTIQAATTRILIRQAASGGAVAGVPMDVAATVRVAGFYFV